MGMGICKDMQKKILTKKKTTYIPPSSDGITPELIVSSKIWHVLRRTFLDMHSSSGDRDIILSENGWVIIRWYQSLLVPELLDLTPQASILPLEAWG